MNLESLRIIVILVINATTNCKLIMGVGCPNNRHWLFIAKIELLSAKLVLCL